MKLTENQFKVIQDGLNHQVKIQDGLQEVVNDLTNLYFNYTILLTEDTERIIKDETTGQLWQLSRLINLLQEALNS